MTTSANLLWGPLLLTPLMALALLVATSNAGSLSNSNNNSNSNKTPSAIDHLAGADAAPNFTTPATSGPDDLDGDDGLKLRQDFEKERQMGASNKSTEDKHQFYRPEYINDTRRAMSYWVDFSKLPAGGSNISTKHEMLSKSHRRAAPIKLSFEFPFYGQPLKSIIIATGGFLYVGEHLHHWLAATQNISPLMANFDLSTSNQSDIHYYDNGTALVVQWLNVQMKDNKPPGNFSFQVTLHKNGDIIFVYHTLPAAIADIPEDEHPVKVGISDAFLIDKVAFFIRRKTIYDYHRLNLKENADIKNQTAIYLKALPTCNQFDSCSTCAKADASLECIWCPAVKRCSNGFDRRRQDWLAYQCDKITKSDCSSNKLNPSASDSSESRSNTNNINNNAAAAAAASSGPNSSPSMSALDGAQQPFAGPNSSRQTVSPRAEGGTAFVTFLMFLALTSGVSLWAMYAYKNPHTPSGQLLIKYRPSNWRWQSPDTRYTAASIHM